LLTTIAGLPHGAVVLPGLDLVLDEEAWRLIGGNTESPPAPSHPQFAMQALLTRLGVRREDVIPLVQMQGREALVSEIMRPAAATHRWRERIKRGLASDIAAGFAGLSVIEAANAEEEALAIAVVLRQTLEIHDATAALVTPDRGLARRVAAALRRWNIVADDSGGLPLSDTSAGRFARLVAEVALSGWAPVPLLAMLKHPLLRLGEAAGAQRRALQALERAALHGPRPRPGSAGLLRTLATLRLQIEKLRAGEEVELHQSDPRAMLSVHEIDQAAQLVRKVANAMRSLEQIAPGQTFAQLASRHRAAVEALSEDARGDVLAFFDSDGEALAETFEDITDQVDTDIGVAAADYGELFLAAIQSRTVRRPEHADVRLTILGPLEARLIEVDRVVLGGLVEGVWPPDVRNDPWLSRPMRQALGLDLPERRIGLSAHDFAQLFGTRTVVLSRAAKFGGAPTVASRFLQRLAAVAGEALWNGAIERGKEYIAWAHTLDQPPKVEPVKRPAPTPPRAVRPARLSVTEIEHWLRDPYSIYAKHILKLRPLDAVDTPPGARDRGIVIHGAIGDFTTAFCDRLPENVFDELIRLGTERFAALDDFPEARAFWWPRYVRIAEWFAGFEKGRRGNLVKLAAETRGTLEIPLGERTFHLTARADRIEHLRDGKFAILDYKTGQVRTPSQVSSGLAPQLTLEGAILRAGSFEGMPSGGSIAELLYVSLRGGQPPGEGKQIKWDDRSVDAECDRALERLVNVLLEFEKEDTPYRSRERPMFMRRGAGDYDHLARVKEWSLSGGADEAEGSE
jgi:ATP-dependent helicase/nuclease subunit B